jgi:hypothetical protein
MWSQLYDFSHPQAIRLLLEGFSYSEPSADTTEVWGADVSGMLHFPVALERFAFNAVDVTNFPVVCIVGSMGNRSRKLF